MKSFLDTTVVVDLVDLGSSRHASTTEFVRANAPAAAPLYALRELLEGKLRPLCDVHNRLLAAAGLGEALMGLASLCAVAGRKKDSAIRAFAKALTKATQTTQSASIGQVREDMLQALALDIASIWIRARKAGGWSRVQPLGCFPVGEISHGAAGELTGAGGSFGCEATARCSAASHLFDHLAEVEKAAEALHPKNLSGPLLAKRETSRRRAALKSLRDLGPKRFNKRDCRALGDAYFAIMCPGTATVVSTNISDFEPLCAALGKRVVLPK